MLVNRSPVPRNSVMPPRIISRGEVKIRLTMAAATDRKKDAPWMMPQGAGTHASSTFSNKAPVTSLMQQAFLESAAPLGLQPCGLVGAFDFRLW